MNLFRELAALLLLAPGVLFAQGSYNDFEDPPHQYWQGTPQDAATALHARWMKGESEFPRDDPKAFLAAYLKELGIAEATQTLVFSRTSFQRDIISASNPRAIYFNDETYLGYIPGGRIEVMGTDPVRGGIFYIFDPPRPEKPRPELERKRACLGCHAGSPTNFLPGLMVNSVLANALGRSLGDAPPRFPGHFGGTRDRWGGWFVTEAGPSLEHLGNRIHTKEAGTLSSERVAKLEERFDPKQYLAGSKSAAASLLLLDHQIGAANRLMEANYRLRTALHRVGGDAPLEKRAIPEEAKEMADEQAERLVSYFLFKDEEPLPEGALQPDPAFAGAFRGKAPSDWAGRSLKQLNLQTRLLQHRCSYMIHSSTFRALPDSFRRMVLARLRSVLVDPPREYAYLLAEERGVIASILAATCPDW